MQFTPPTPCPVLRGHEPIAPIDWLCLSLLEGAGPTRLDRLWLYVQALDSLGSQVKLNELDMAFFSQLKWPKTLARSAADYCQQGVLAHSIQQKLMITLDWWQQPDHHILWRKDSEYPERLAQIPVPPLLLYVIGNVSALNHEGLGIVGSRHCSSYGRLLAGQFAKRLGEAGLTIISGGAMGIDSAAHEGALSASVVTIAVMGAGLLHYYPRANRPLFQRIQAQGGALVSEYPLTTVPRPNLFPPRNRIISGLSLGVLVVEAAEKSGSLISASYALQHNREVFAIPGRIDASHCRGANRLIQQGARLVMDVSDILSELPQIQDWFDVESRLSDERDTLIATRKRPETSVSDLAQRLLDWCDTHTIDTIFMFDDLIDALACGTSELMQALMELEMQSCVESIANGYRRGYHYSE